MQVALCLAGFSRIIHSTEHIKKILLKSLPSECKHVDIFWWCPTTIDPNKDDLLDQDKLINCYKELELGEVVIEFFKYEPTKFYEKVMQLGFKVSDVETANPTYSRRLSDIYNRSNSIRLAYEFAMKNNIKYDWVILSRNDYIHCVENFGLQKDLKKGIYNYRTFPYRTNSSQVNPSSIPSMVGLLDTEDRAFFGSPEYMFDLRFFYDDINHLYNCPKLYTEVLHTKFFINRFGTDICHYIEGSIIHFPEKKATVEERRVSHDELNFYKDHNYK